jgi:hypothetical protein
LFAVQLITRPKLPNGTKPSAYIINDGSHTLCIQGGERDLYVWLGNGDIDRGRTVYNTRALLLPEVNINASQFNTMITSIRNGSDTPFVDKGEFHH